VDRKRERKREREREREREVQRICIGDTSDFPVTSAVF
jgi:hypothetical protein